MRRAMLSWFPSSSSWMLQAVLATTLLLPVASSAAADPYGLDTRPPAQPYLNVPSTPPVPAGGFIATVAFPNLTFQGAVAVRAVPGTNRLWVLEREGRIWSFEDDPATTTKTLVLDLNAPEHQINGVRWWCQGWDDCGLMGLAFHPQFGQVGSPNERTFFLGYQARNQAPAVGSPGDFYRPVTVSYGNDILGCSNRLARFTYNSAPTTTVGSEVILIDQPDRHLWHNGADVFFGSDGFLYCIYGDEGKSDDSFVNSQRINRNFLAGVVRLDVDGPRAGISHAIPRAPSKRNPNDANEPAPFSGNYGIPNDNPFVGVPGVLEEFYALGLRSPHRMTYDPLSGRILVGDIGQGAREEVDLIVPGGNYQWAYKEGHKNHRSDRIPSPYQAANATTAGVSTVALSYVAPSATPDLPAGMVYAGDRVRFANHGATYQILSISGYPHASVALSSPLVQAVPAGTAMIRTTGFTIASLGTSTPASDLPNDLGSATILLNGTGTLVEGTSVSFPGVAGSFQIITASGSPTTTSITVRPALGSTPAIGATVDRLTVIGSEQPPVMDFARNGAMAFSAIIGGYIYRGTEHPSLVGKYLLADNQRGTVYAIDGIGTTSPTIQTLFTMPNYAQFDANGYRGIGGFGLNHANEPLICRMQVNGAQTNTSSGQLWKIARDSGSVIGTPIPSELKDTGAFTLDGDGTLTSMTPAPSLIPYEVNSPLWSDAAHKRRWVSIPDGQQVHFTTNGSWTFPAGTVFVKHFELTINEQTGTRRRLETRLLVRSPNDGVYGVTYKWNTAGTQATLVSDAGVSETYTITAANGTSTRTQTWNYPSRNDCLSCHNANAGHVLGVSTRQLNGTCTYPTTGASDNQLRTWSHIGLFDAPPTEPAIPTLSRMVPVSDSGATLEQRVRSWLDANCSHCHRPGGVHANFDARFDTPLASQGIVDGMVNSTLGVADARVIAPGSLLRSLMHTRDNSLDPAIKMPPLAKNLVDTQAIAVMESWIASLAVSADVALTAPTSGSIVVRTTSTTVSASVTGSAGVTSVDFLANGTVVGNDTTAPYSIAWSPAVSGPSVLTAIAHTTVGEVSSPGVSITVIDAPLPPSVTLTSPSAGSSATAPATVALTATASDVDGTVTQVEFLQDGVVVASDTSAPYQASAADLAAGTYAFAARATDSQGLITTSASAVVVVEASNVQHGLLGTYYDNQNFTGTALTRLDPVVDFTWGGGAPITGIDRETFTVRWQGSVRTMPTVVPGALESYSFHTTSDDGVRLWINGTLIINNWTDHGATVDTGTIQLLGDHEYAVVMEFYDAYIDATARLEWSSPSVARAIIPAQRLTPPGSTPPPPQPPTVAITAPVTGGSMVTPGAVSLTATASDTDGTITQVEFLQNNVVVATDTNAPYSTSVSALAVGSYSFIARATDSQGLSATSTPVVFTVTAAPVPPTVALTAPANGATTTAPGTVVLSATASDSDGGVTQVEFLQGGVVIASDTNAPYTASVSGLAIGSHVFAARATDSQGLTTTTPGATVTVTAAPLPVPPTVALTAPTNGATATAPAAFTLTASASDSDGTITQVEFLQNGVVVASDAAAPFGASLTGLAVGTYSLTARATDSQGLTATSASVTVTVTAPSSTQGLSGTYYDNRDFTGTTLTRIDPTVDFIWGGGAPAPGIDRETFSVRWQGNVRTMPGATAAYTFYTTSDDGVRLWVNGVLLIDHWNDHGSTVDTGIITLAGDQNYPLVMEFYDSYIDATARLEWSSAAVPRAIIPAARLSPPGSTPPPPQPPTVALTAPANGMTSVAPAAFTLSATASDSDGTVTQVEFLQGGVVVATDTTAPYTGNVSGLAVGSYTVAARASDSQGLSTTTATVTVTVTAGPVPPSIALIAPVNGATAIAPATFALAANASDSDGSITLVEFLQGGVVVASDTTAPYTASVSGLAVGSYTVAARATDSQGLSTTTAAVTVTVTATPVPPTVVLTAPVSGASTTAPGTFALAANASDSDGSIMLVEFLQGGVVIASDTTAPYTASASGLAVGTYTFAARAIDSQGLSSTTATVSVTVTAAPGGTGVQATYFDNQDFTGTSVTRIDAVIDFPWDFTPPVAGIGADTYSVRWRGLVTPPTGGTWTFYTTSDDGVRLWIDNTLIINNWSNHGSTVDSGTITLTGGQSYELAMDYYESAVGAIARLEWSGPSVARAVVATQYLAPPPLQGAPGTILREWWNNINGTSVADLTGAPAFPLTPGGRAWPVTFEAPNDAGDNYGTRMSGYVIAPVSGTYVFWISGDDNCELWLSSNDLAANKVLIAGVPGATARREWTKYPQQQSAAIALSAGATYYIEALHKEGYVGDHLAVGWQLPGGALERPIPGNRLLPYIITLADVRPVGWSVRPLTSARR